MTSLNIIAAIVFALGAFFEIGPLVFVAILVALTSVAVAEIKLFILRQSKP